MAIEPHRRTLPELIKTAKALDTKLAQSEGKSADLKITLGLTLAEAKARKPDDITWPDFVKKHFNFGRSRADELIQIADGRTTVEKTREGRALSMRKQRAADPPTRVGESPQPATNAPKEDQAHQEAEHETPADAVKAAADRAQTKTPKPVPDVAPAADRAEVTPATAMATKPEESRIEMVESVARTPAKFREAMNQIASAETTPEAYWAEAAREMAFWDHAFEASVTLLDSVILKVAAIKARQPGAGV
jgi:hypothetical protein